MFLLGFILLSVYLYLFVVCLLQNNSRSYEQILLAFSGNVDNKQLLTLWQWCVLGVSHHGWENEMLGQLSDCFCSPLSSLIFHTGSWCRASKHISWYLMPYENTASSLSLHMYNGSGGINLHRHYHYSKIFYIFNLIVNILKKYWGKLSIIHSTSTAFPLTGLLEPVPGAFG